MSAPIRAVSVRVDGRPLPPRRPGAVLAEAVERGLIDEEPPPEDDAS